MYKRIGLIATVISIIAVAFLLLTNNEINDEKNAIKEEVRLYQKEKKDVNTDEDSKVLTKEELSSMSEKERQELGQLIEDRMEEAKQKIIPSDGLDEMEDTLLEDEGNSEPFESFSLEEIFGKDEVDSAKETAIKFIEQYYNFDGDEPDKYVKKAKDYMTEDFYAYSIKNERVPYQSSFYSEYVGVEHHVSAYKPKDDNKSMPLIFYVNGINKDPFGKVTSETTDIYILEMVKTNDGYKVNNIAINIPYY